MKTVVVTLNIGNYQPAIRALTYPLMQQYAEKIRAEWVEITERKFPEWPTVMEKFQCAEIGRKYDADWTIFFDADALISPEFFNPTTHLTLDTVMFNGKDMSELRFYPDQYFLRDGRRLGACNWFCCVPRWCRDDFYSLPNIPFEECVRNIKTTIGEHNSGLFKDNHLIDDYSLSRNIARFGIKHDTAIELCARMGWRNPQTGIGHNGYLFHLYAIPEQEKLDRMLQHLSAKPEQGGWGLMTVEDANAFKSAVVKDERGQLVLGPAWEQYKTVSAMSIPAVAR